MMPLTAMWMFEMELKTKKLESGYIHVLTCAEYTTVAAMAVRSADELCEALGEK